MIIDKSKDAPFTPSPPRRRKDKEGLYIKRVEVLHDGTPALTALNHGHLHAVL